MKRRRLVGEQSVDGGGKGCYSADMNSADMKPSGMANTLDALRKMWPRPCMPEALTLLDFGARCRLEYASRSWRLSVRRMPPGRLADLWRHGVLSLWIVLEQTLLLSNFAISFKWATSYPDVVVLPGLVLAHCAWRAVCLNEPGHFFRTFFCLFTRSKGKVLQLIWGLWKWILGSFQILYNYIYLVELNCIINRRKFRSQTSDNTDRWKAEMERVREKRKIRREKSRRERVRRKKMQMREKVGKSRNTVFFQWFVAPEGRKVGSLKRRVRSQLAKWEMKNCTPLWREAHFQVKMYNTHHCRTTFGSWDVEKVHAVVARRTFPSQNVQNKPLSDHFWKLRCRKSARRCGAKHISKSKCTKHTMVGPLLEVEMSKKCTLLWREAHFEVKMYKTHHGRTTFGGWDVASVHYTTLHYTTLQDITLHYTPVHYITLH